MKIKISTAVSIGSMLSGGVFLVIPNTAIPYIGWPFFGLGALVGLWTLAGFLYFRKLARLIESRTDVRFMKADFTAIGMSSPYVDFYFEVHSYLSSCIMVTGEKKGDLWNPAIEAWKSSWEVDTKYQSVIKPDTDNEFRIRWYVPQGHHSPMSEFAFRASDEPAEQDLTFEDMKIELKASFMWLEREIGWLALSEGVVRVPIPNHHVFETVRREYLRQKEEDKNAR